MQENAENWTDHIPDETREVSLEDPLEVDEHIPEEPMEEALPDHICIACRQQEKDILENKYSQLCLSCRQQFIHYPIPRWVKFLFYFILIFTIASSYRLPAAIQDLKKYQEAGHQYREGNYYNSALLYDELLAKYDGSLPIALRLADACMEQQNFYYASYIINTYIAERNLDDQDYKAIVQHIDLLDRYYGVFMKVEEFASEANKLNISDADYDEYAKYISQQIDSLDEQEYDKSTKLFYLSMVEPNRENALALLQQAYELEPEYTYIELYRECSQVSK